jgi:hypothetical protein
MEKTNKMDKKRYDWLKPYQFKQGHEGGPGRPKGKTLKEFAREYLQSLPDERKIEYLSTLPEEIVWKMAEGNPESKTDITSAGKPIIQIAGEVAAKYDINSQSGDNSQE